MPNIINLNATQASNDQKYDVDTIEKLTEKSLKSMHKQMKNIPSAKLRFIFSKKEEELNHAINSKTLD